MTPDQFDRVMGLVEFVVAGVFIIAVYWLFFRD
jgi:hypothetical protein